MAKKIGEKHFLIILLAWFIFSYLLLWFFGGACTSVFGFPASVSVDKVCLSESALSGLRNIPLVGMFLPYNAWVSVMYFFAPIAGFVLAYFLIKWFNEYFDSKLAVSIWFLVLMIFVLLFGYYINLSWYYQEAATLNSNSQVKVSLNPFLCFFEPSSQSCASTVSKINNEYYAQYQAGTVQVLQQYLTIDFWAKLRESIYLLFVLGALAAWLPLFARQLFERYVGGEEDKHVHHEHKASHQEPKTPQERELTEMSKEVFETEKEFEKSEN